MSLTANVVIVERPVGRSCDVPYVEPAAAGLQVGLVRRDPEIEADVRLVGMDVDARSLMLADERPPVVQVMSTQQLGQGLAQLCCDLQQQRTEEAGLGICPEIARWIGAAPNGRSQAEALQLGERFRCQQMIDKGDPFALAFEGIYDIAPIISPVEAEGRRCFIVQHERRIGHQAAELAAQGNRGDLVAGAIEQLVELALRNVSHIGGHRQQRAGCKIVGLFQVDELFEVVQRLMRGKGDRPAGRRAPPAVAQGRAPHGNRPAPHRVHPALSARGPAARARNVPGDRPRRP